jgi:hypothetical protein
MASTGYNMVAMSESKKKRRKYGKQAPHSLNKAA